MEHSHPHSHHEYDPQRPGTLVELAASDPDTLAAELCKLIEKGTFDRYLEAILAAAHNRKRDRRSTTWRPSRRRF